jgi:hypothetical protein
MSRHSTRVRGHLFAAIAVCGFVLAGSAFAATSSWVKEANSVCLVWQKKAAASLGANPKQPTTLKGMYEFMVKARPIESGELHALEAMPQARPAGALHAFALAREDIKEIDAGIAAYRAGRQAAFIHDADVWQSDSRTSKAFTALGATTCA